MKNFLLVLLILTLYSCKHEDITNKAITNKAIINIGKIPKEGIILNKWQVLGPFQSNNMENYINTDNLKLFGFSEPSIPFTDFLRISKQQVKDTISLDTSFNNIFYFSDKIPLDFFKVLSYNKEKVKGNIYAACVIKSSKEINTRLHFSCSGGEKIWLNGKLICVANYSKPLLSYEQFIPINLKKGDNMLLVKTNKFYNELEMYARLENVSETGLKRQFILRNHSIIYGSVHESDSIRMDPVFPQINGRILISDSNNKTILSDTIIANNYWATNVSSLKDGIYLAKFISGKINLTQDLYIGKIHDTIPKIIKELQSVKISDDIKDNIDALIFRYNYLLTQTYPTDSKYVSLFIQLNNAYSGIVKNTNPFHHTAGCFIRSYISRIDSSKQYYILHVPSTYKKNSPSQVAMVIPATVYGNFPYLKSFRVGNSKLVTFFQDLAEKFNMILVEPGSRRYNLPNFNTIEEAELFNIIKEIEKDYNVDKKRIYLTGTCSGGNEALKLGVEFPDYFAAIGLVSPEIIYPDENTYSPITFIKNIVNIPIFNTHSLIDRHIAVERSELLAEIAKQLNFSNFKYIRMPNEFPMYYPDDFFDDALEYCSKFSLDMSPKEIDFTTAQIIYNKSFWITINSINSVDVAHIKAKIKWNTLSIEKENIIAYSINLKMLPYNRNKVLKVIENGKLVFNGVTDDTVLYIGPSPLINSISKNNVIAGPFAHVFAQKFIIVKGSTGSQLENKGIACLADTINKYWNERYFTNCTIKNDFEISEKDIAGSNLVLLGNYSSNLLLNKIQGKIPLKISDTDIQISSNKTEGNRLCFYLIYPNPLNKNNYVAIIGYNNPDYISLGAEREKFDDVSNYGWYDYKIWEANNNIMNTIFSGYFSRNWELQ